MLDVEARTESQQALVVRVGAMACALPLAAVIETMRPMPVRPLPQMPAVVEGVALVRGVATPVLRLGRLFDQPETSPGRLVTLRVGMRAVGLAVDAVIGLRPLPQGALPPLLSQASQQALAGLATLDGDLLAVLDAARLLPVATLAFEAVEASG